MPCCALLAGRTGGETPHMQRLMNFYESPIPKKVRRPRSPGRCLYFPFQAQKSSPGAGVQGYLAHKEQPPPLGPP